MHDGCLPPPPLGQLPFKPLLVQDPIAAYLCDSPIPSASNAQVPLTQN